MVAIGNKVNKVAMASMVAVDESPQSKTRPYDPKSLWNSTLFSAMLQANEMK